MPEEDFAVAWAHGLTLLKQHQALETQLNEDLTLTPSDRARVAKEMSLTAAVKEVVTDIITKNKELEAIQSLLVENKGKPSELAWIEAEKESCERDLGELKARFVEEILPKDADDSRNVILEVRPGTGGVEAALFTEDVFAMYQKYSEAKGWKFQVLESSRTELGGLKSAIALVSGENVFGYLKHESGTHRVQRIPRTEASGRVHTSAMMVMILPEAKQVDVQIRESDLRIDVYRSSGAGGQSVNTTDSAVRVTHIPTGMTVAMQDERSQHQNKAKALTVLRARLYEIERKQMDDERQSTRREQMGSGDRSDRIRTYNFPQSRVTDHRTGTTLHTLAAVMEGEQLDTIIDDLRQKEKVDALKALVGKEE